MRVPLPPVPGGENGGSPIPIPIAGALSIVGPSSQGEDMLIGSRQSELTIELRVGAIPKANTRGQWFPQSKSGNFRQLLISGK